MPGSAGTRLVYLRLVQLVIHEQSLAEVVRFYAERAVPALGRVEGCRFAGLLRHDHRPEECVSLTLWESTESAATYERGAVYGALLAELRPHVSRRAAWRVELASLELDDTLPSEPRPPSAGYAIEAGDSPEVLGTGRLPHRFYIRIVTIHLKPGKEDEFKRHYRTHIVPALHEVKGCLAIFLGEAVGRSAELQSITIWNREEDAVRYEMSGKFEELASPVRHTFSGVSSWTTSRVSAPERQVATDALDVAGYSLVAGGPL